jgi:hypothetical protein
MKDGEVDRVVKRTSRSGSSGAVVRRAPFFWHGLRSGSLDTGVSRPFDRLTFMWIKSVRQRAPARPASLVH